MPIETTADPSPTVSELEHKVAELSDRLRAEREEYNEALQREAALAEILRVINEPGTDLARVFSVMIEKATKLCSASYGYVWRYDGKLVRAVAASAQQTFGDWLRDSEPRVPAEQSPLGQALLSRRLVHVIDAKEDEAYKTHLPFRELVDRGGVRTLLHVPLLKGNELLGVITVYRQEPRAFSERQIALIESFAAQAVIAMENARLINEMRDALEQQTATAEVLQVINSSPGNLAPVFDAMLQKALALCGAAFGQLVTFDGVVFRAAAWSGYEPGPSGATAPSPGMALYQLVHGEQIIHIPDITADDVYRSGNAVRRRLADEYGGRTAIWVALRKDAALLGAFVIYRTKVRPFSDKQIALLQNFAAQAVIAIENARLLTEQREALERQTAMAEVLQVINSSPGQLAPVFDAMLDRAIRLCGAKFGSLLLCDGPTFNAVAGRNLPPAYAQALHAHPIQAGPDTALGQMAERKVPVHVKDMLTDAAYAARDALRMLTVELGGVRSVVAIPLLKEGELIGAFVIYRSEAGGFTDSQIALVSSFADQAVIAVENARLLTEQREALDRQMATTEVLQVINSSPGDLGPVFDATLESATRLCEAAFGILWLCDGERFHAAALHGAPERYAEIARVPHSPHPGNPLGRMLRGERLIVSLDVADEEPYRAGDPVRRALVEVGGARSVVQVALVKDDVFLGSLTVYRQEVRPFSEKQIVLLQNFAAQAVIAIENARLITETREALEQQTATTEVLQVINFSPGDLAPVFDAMLDKATRLSEAAFGILWTHDGERFQAVAFHSVPPAYVEFLQEPQLASPVSPLGRVARGEAFAHVPDLAADEYQERAGFLVRQGLSLAGFRTVLAVAMRKDASLLGAITIYRREVQPFSDKQVALLQNFAAQAVIAMENARLLGELRESLDQQTATTEVLAAINSSPGDLTPVFESMLEKAHALCRVEYGSLQLYDGTMFRAVAVHNLPDALAARLREGYAPGPAFQRLIEGADFDHTPDVAEVDDPMARTVVDAGIRTLLRVALRKEGKLLGQIVAARKEVRPFADKEIALLQSFASQAVIAMENARLLGELRQRTDDLTESLEYQTATSEVLEVIGRSTSDIQPVLDTMLSAALRLCRTQSGGVAIQQGDKFRYIATLGWDPEADRVFRSMEITAGRGTVAARVLAEGRVVQVADVASDSEFERRDMARLAHWHTALGVPLMREGRSIGAIAITRNRVEPFTERQIALVRTFADQAVIAMENARLLGELRQRQAELARSVDELTAITDVLKIISRSPSHLQPVLDTIATCAVRLCGASMGAVYRFDGELVHLAAHHNYPPEALGHLQQMYPRSPRTDQVSGRAILTRAVSQIEDSQTDPLYRRELAIAAGWRSQLGVPMLRDGEPHGAIVIARSEAGLFSDAHIEVLKTFADQAVIAIENTRLFEEVRDRQAELRVTFDNMGDGVAMFDGDHCLAAWNRNFQQIMGLSDEWLAGRPTYAAYLGLLADRGEFGTENVEAELASRLEDTERELRLERTRSDGTIIEVRRNAVPDGGFVLIYSDVTQRRRAEAAIRQARDVAETALKELKTAQASLIHAEKMASLGQLTAGIAHEIKNPLNFVNNFASLSSELIDELKQTVDALLAEPDEDKRAELQETVDLLTGNLAKIVEHGKRADGIVKSMLLHSRGGSSDRQTVDINAVLEEALNLAYHGARAQDQSFNVTFERDLQADMAPIEIVPQDLTRVFLNLIGNGFYAVTKRKRQEGDAFRPMLKLTTRELPDAVEIAIRDNGVGIPAEHRNRLFQPFFTTKPTGEGTGLGLSISYDIVTQQHGGTIDVDSEPGRFTQFSIRLPRRRRPGPAAGTPA